MSKMGMDNEKLKVENEKHKTLCSTTLQSVGVAVKNKEKDFSVPC